MASSDNGSGYRSIPGVSESVFDENDILPFPSVAIDAAADGKGSREEDPLRPRTTATTTTLLGDVDDIYDDDALRTRAVIGRNRIAYAFVGAALFYCAASLVNGGGGGVALVSFGSRLGGGGYRSRESVAQQQNPQSAAEEVASIWKDKWESSFVVNGLNFFDSLPFDDVFPSASGIEIEGSIPASASLFRGSILSPILSNVATASTTATVSPPSMPHLLYHAHPSAFNLLYNPRTATSSDLLHVNEYAVDYFLLNSGGFDAQINQAYCAVATSAAILNSLRYTKRFREPAGKSGNDGTDDANTASTEPMFDLPVDTAYDPYPYATQRDLLESDCAYANVVHVRNGEDGVFKPPYGLSLAQTAELLRCYAVPEEGWKVIAKEMNTTTPGGGSSSGDGAATTAKMRFHLTKALVDPSARVLINYNRKALGQVGGGHFSPIGAYHAPTDSFLILDVAKYKYPPVWVTAEALFRAMSTVDRCGWYDFPEGQERLVNADGLKVVDKNGKLLHPASNEDYNDALVALGCEERFRGFIILKKE